jgi:hypothetical protein
MGVTDRIIQIGGQISGNPTAGGREKILQKNPDDVSFQDTKSYFMRQDCSLTSTDRRHRRLPKRIHKGRPWWFQGYTRC